MQKLYKITIVLLILVILLNMCSNIVYALEKEKITVQSIGIIEKHLKYLDENTKEYKYYETDIEGYIGTDGKKYPVYNLEEISKSVNEEPYYAFIENNINNKQIENIIKNGYSYKSAKDWNLQEENDLYVITKIAIQCILGKRKLENFYAEKNDKEAIVMLESLKQIIEIVANTTIIQNDNNIIIEKVEEQKEKCEINEVRSGRKVKDNKEIYVVMENKKREILEDLEIIEKSKEEEEKTDKSEEIKEEEKTDKSEEIKEEEKTDKTEEIKEEGKSNKEEIKKKKKEDSKKEEIKEVEGRIKIVTKSKDYNKIIKSKKGEAIQGAKFEIYNEKGEKILMIKTDKNGEALTSKLKKGKYKIKQISTNKYYYINNYTAAAEIKKNDEITQINIENESKNPEIKIEQSGIDKAEIGRKVEYDISIKNVGNTEVKNFVFQGDIPTKDINVINFKTGTYNQNLCYDVYVKTNMTNNKYVLFMEDLSSKEDYKIDFSKELADNECIEYIKLDFGTVDAGFCSNENPHINAIINKDVKSETIFNCKSTLSGQFGRYKMQDISMWKTFAYKLLPKTGV